jgi:uncharacterized protein (TIGR02246 family)
MMIENCLRVALFLAVIGWSGGRESLAQPATKAQATKPPVVKLKLPELPEAKDPATKRPGAKASEVSDTVKQTPASAKEAPAGGAAREADEAAIRATVEKFVEAYNLQDADAVAELFLPKAQILDADDNAVEGRENIATLFAEVFQEHPETGIEIEIDSIRFIGPNLALETGVSVTVPPEGGIPEAGRYSCLHIRQDGKWSMGLVRDIPAEPTHRDQLEALAWLVGDWVDESRDGRVKTSCRWTEDGSFLLQEVTVTPVAGEVTTLSQRIGWDPLGKRFKSWVFDSAGGYGEGNWTPTETGWLIKFTGVSSDGSIASATNHIEPIGLDRYVFESADRVLGNMLMNATQVIVVRQPPQPDVSQPEEDASQPEGQAQPADAAPPAATKPSTP